MFALAFQYAVFICVAACGVIQVATSHAGLHGLLLLPGRRASTFLGYALLGGAFAWFFGLVDRNVRGLEGLEQALLFVPGVLSAVVVTLVVSSLVRQRSVVRRSPSSLPSDPTPPGLEALREMSYLDALLRQREKIAQ